MRDRANTLKGAEQVQIAVELARAKAGAVLIEDMTGFGVRWIRRTIRKHGGTLSHKWSNESWFDGHPKRLLQAAVFLRAYELQPNDHLPGRKLLDAHAAYGAFAGADMLDINKCAQLVKLRESKEIWERTCNKCHSSYLVISECALCPICRLMERVLCRGCEQKPPSDPSRRYCADCSPPSVRRQRQRRQ